MTFSSAKIFREINIREHDDFTEFFWNTHSYTVNWFHENFWNGGKFMKLPHCETLTVKLCNSLTFVQRTLISRNIFQVWVFSFFNMHCEHLLYSVPNCTVCCFKCLVFTVWKNQKFPVVTKNFFVKATP